MDAYNEGSASVVPTHAYGRSDDLPTAPTDVGNNGEFRGASLSDHSALVRLLETRQHEMLNDVQQRLRDVREEWTRTHEVSDTADTSEVDARDDIQLELIRMKADTLHQINDALSRVHNGTHGYCVDCRHKIPERRLRALPFAARCKGCEEAREATERRVRVAALIRQTAIRMTTNISKALTNHVPKETTMSRCRDLMTTNPVSCSSTDTVRSAAQLMKREDVGFLPVVKDRDDKKLIGVVTDRDLVLNLIVEARQADTTTIADVMTAKPVSCRADDDLEQAISAMAQHQIRRVPIVDESEQIVGIIAQADIALRIDDPTAITEILRKISKPTPLHPSMAIAE